jgi:hypothetical protein
VVETLLFSKSLSFILFKEEIMNKDIGIGTYAVERTFPKNKKIPDSIEDNRTKNKII